MMFSLFEYRLVAVILEAEKLSKDAQHALRRTMEKYSSNVRLILLSNSPSRILRPIRSRCLQLRLAAPTTIEINDVLFNILKKENIKCDSLLVHQISKECKGNLRVAILMTEELSKQ